MEDKKLKDFLQKNSKVAPRPAGEWDRIVSKIERDKSKVSWWTLSTWKPVGVLATTLLIVVIGFNRYDNSAQNKRLNNEKIGSFLLENSYFEEIEEQEGEVRGYLWKFQQLRLD